MCVCLSSHVCQSRRHQPRPVSSELTRTPSCSVGQTDGHLFFIYIYLFSSISFGGLQGSCFSSASVCPTRCLVGVFFFFELSRVTTRFCCSALPPVHSIALSLASSSSEPLCRSLSPHLFSPHLFSPPNSRFYPFFLSFFRFLARFSVSKLSTLPRLAQLVPGYIPSFGPSVLSLTVTPGPSGLFAFSPQHAIE